MTQSDGVDLTPRGRLTTPLWTVHQPVSFMFASRCTPLSSTRRILCAFCAPRPYIPEHELLRLVNDPTSNPPPCSVALSFAEASVALVLMDACGVCPLLPRPWCSFIGVTLRSGIGFHRRAQESSIASVSASVSQASLSTLAMGCCSRCASRLDPLNEMPGSALSSSSARSNFLDLWFASVATHTHTSPPCVTVRICTLASGLRADAELCHLRVVQRMNRTLGWHIRPRITQPVYCGRPKLSGMSSQLAVGPWLRL